MPTNVVCHCAAAARVIAPQPVPQCAHWTCNVGLTGPTRSLASACTYSTAKHNVWGPTRTGTPYGVPVTVVSPLPQVDSALPVGATITGNTC
jgi:hypothetical protein